MIAFYLQDCHLLWSLVPECSIIQSLFNRTAFQHEDPILSHNPRSTTHADYKLNGFRLFPFHSPLLGESVRFLFLEVLRCFTSLGIASYTYEFSVGSCGITRKGFPHSEISGSKPVCGSPKHIAAYHVLHRLLTPSHPPQALRSLTFVSYNEDLRLTLIFNYQRSKKTKFFGVQKYGPERARTADPLLAKQVLYQLSYRPDIAHAKNMVGRAGIAPATPALSALCSAN